MDFTSFWIAMLLVFAAVVATMEKPQFQGRAVPLSFHLKLSQMVPHVVTQERRGMSQLESHPPLVERHFH